MKLLADPMARSARGVGSAHNRVTELTFCHFCKETGGTDKQFLDFKGLSDKVSRVSLGASIVCKVACKNLVSTLLPNIHKYMASLVLKMSSETSKFF